MGVSRSTDIHNLRVAELPGMFASLVGKSKPFPRIVGIPIVVFFVQLPMLGNCRKL